MKERSGKRERERDEEGVKEKQTKRSRQMRGRGGFPRCSASVALQRSVTGRGCLCREVSRSVR